jgi:hypothetical protein
MKKKRESAAERRVRLQQEMIRKEAEVLMGWKEFSNSYPSTLLKLVHGYMMYPHLLELTANNSYGDDRFTFRKIGSYGEKRSLPLILPDEYDDNIMYRLDDVTFELNAAIEKERELQAKEAKISLALAKLTPEEIELLNLKK